MAEFWMTHKVSRAEVIFAAGRLKSLAPGFGDIQILSVLEASYCMELNATVPLDDPFYFLPFQVLEVLFQELREEILDDPPTLAFEATDWIRVKEPRTGEYMPLEQQIAEWRASRFNACKLSAMAPAHDQVIAELAAEFIAGFEEAKELESLASSTEVPSSMSNASSMAKTVTEAQGRAGGLSHGSPHTTCQTDSETYSATNINNKREESSTTTTKAYLDWQSHKCGDPFGTRVSTKELATMEPPFELSVTHKFNSVRDNMLYESGIREATAHFPLLQIQPIQPLWSSVDHMPDTVKAYTAANNKQNEEDVAELKVKKAKELSDVGAHEITTARGLRAEFKNAEPTYTQTFSVALNHAKLEPTVLGAYEHLNEEGIRKYHRELIAKNKDLPGMPIGEEEYEASSSAQNPVVDVTITEDEPSCQTWAFPKADQVLDNAQMQYDMMYQIITQMQRERLGLGPEVSDYEVIDCAYAGYIAASKEEAAGLARAAEGQKAKALALSVVEDLRKAQVSGRPNTRYGGLLLTQDDIADVIERCEQVGVSSSAIRDFVEDKFNITGSILLSANRYLSEEDKHVDPFIVPSDINPSAAAPTPVQELVDFVRLGVNENLPSRGRGNSGRGAPRGGRPARPIRHQSTVISHFESQASKIEADLAEMAKLNLKLGGTPRDFSKELEEINKELAELKAHGAAYPGDSNDLVQHYVDDDDYEDFYNDSNYLGAAPDHGRASAEDVAEAEDKKQGEQQQQPAAAASKKRQPNRAERRRLARQQAKGKGKA